MMGYFSVTMMREPHFDDLVCAMSESRLLVDARLADSVCRMFYFENSFELL